LRKGERRKGVWVLNLRWSGLKRGERKFGGGCNLMKVRGRRLRGNKQARWKERKSEDAKTEKGHK